jgi:hypothetical protein
MSMQEKEKAQEKTVTIIVNGRQKEVNQKEISFQEVVNLAFDNAPPTGENIVITVTFSRGDEGRKEGSLLPGDKVKVKKDMVFDVTATDKS